MTGAFWPWFSSLSALAQALAATLFTWGVTAAGAAMVFFVRRVDRRVLAGMNGFAAGVMMAASFWSLLAPAIAMADDLGSRPWLPATAGFLGGALFLFALDRILPHLHPGAARDEAEGPATSWGKTRLLVLAVTLHNVPEGLAVGVAFGAVAAGLEAATLAGAVALAVGIGLQNFPEGVAVAMPLRGEGMSRRRAFWIGQLSGAVEPVAGLVGAGLVLLVRPALPYALAFAAGAMVFVVVEDLIPEAERTGHNDLATMSAVAGFATMMLLDVALG